MEQKLLQELLLEIYMPILIVIMKEHAVYAIKKGQEIKYSLFAQIAEKIISQKDLLVALDALYVENWYNIKLFLKNKKTIILLT